MTVGFPCGLLRGGTNFRVVIGFIARKGDGPFISCSAASCDEVRLTLPFALAVQGL